MSAALEILAKNRKIDNDVNILEMMSSSNYFGITVFLLPSLVTGPTFMSISLLVLEL